MYYRTLDSTACRKDFFEICSIYGVHHQIALNQAQYTQGQIPEPESSLVQKIQLASDFNNHQGYIIFYFKALLETI